jgi:hypothetical protein
MDHYHYIFKLIAKRQRPTANPFINKDALDRGRILDESEASPRSRAGHPDKDGGTLHSLEPSFPSSVAGYCGGRALKLRRSLLAIHPRPSPPSAVACYGGWAGGAFWRRRVNWPLKKGGNSEKFRNIRHEKPGRDYGSPADAF